MQMLTELAAAVVLAHYLHAFGEMTNVRAKLKRLSDAIAGRPLKPYPININTRLKALGLGSAMYVVLVVVSLIVISAVGFSESFLLRMIVALILVTEVITLIGYDQYHVDIQKLIHKFSKKAGK